MKLRKEIINGKVVYVPIDEENNEEDVEVVDAEIEDDESFKKKADSNDTKEKVKRVYDKVDQKMKEFGKVTGEAIDVIAEKIEEATTKVTASVNKGMDDINRNKKLRNMLPFMDDDDIKELVEEMLNSEDSMKNLDIESLLPFLDEDDADKLLLRCIRDGKNKFKSASFAPFVSGKCLKEIVDLYINGEIQSLNINGLLPFLSSADVKRIFKYEMNK